MKLRKALCLLLSMALILSIGMPGTLAIEASGDDTTPETTETTASTEGAEEKNERPTNAVAEATTGSVTAEETEEVHDGPTELAITEGAEEDNNESAESVTEETTEATTTEDTVAELESSEPENPPASFGTSLGSGSVAVGDTIWIKSGSQTYKQPDTASVSREVLFNYQTKILSVITDDTGDVWYEFEPTGLLQLFSDYKYVRIESTSVEEPTAPEETEDGNDCTCGDTAPEDLSKHADSCPRKQYVLGLIKNETGSYKTAAEIHADWDNYDSQTQTDILNMVNAYVPTEYDALVELIEAGSTEDDPGEVVLGELAALEESYTAVTVDTCEAFYEDMMAAYSKAFENDVVIVSLEQLKEIDAKFGALQDDLYDDFGYTQVQSLAAQPAVLSDGGTTDGSNGTEGAVFVDKKVSVGEDGVSEFLLTLESYVTGTSMDYTIPVDLILVLDQSASMYAPMGVASGLKNTTLYTDNSDNLTRYALDYGSLSAAIGCSDLRAAFNSTEVDSTGLTFKEKVSQLGYLVAQSRSGGTVYCTNKEEGHEHTDTCKTYDWFVVQYVENDPEGKPWHLYRIKQTACPSNDYLNNQSYETKCVKYASFDDMGDSHFYFYKSQTGALYDGILSFAKVLRDSGGDHRLAIAGFSGYDAVGHKSYGNTNLPGTCIYVNGNRIAYNNTYTAQTSRYDSTITNTDYASALMSVQTNYEGIQKSLAAVKTDFYGTYHDIGFDMALNIINNATEVETDLEGYSRETIVVMFTDGEPSGPKTGDVVAKAKEVKDRGAQVYTICTSTLSADKQEFITVSSSDYPDATGAYGENSYSSGSMISNPKYAKTAESTADLVKQFISIAEDVGGANIELDEKTILLDAISRYFTLPEELIKSIGTNGKPSAETLAKYIKVYTADYNGTSFETEVAFDDANVEISKGDDGRYSLIRVTNFDYSENFVSENGRGDNNAFHGKKLIVKIAINSESDFLGGNNVDTNGTASGIYDSDGNKIAVFPVPEANVQIKQDDSAAESNVYLGGYYSQTITSEQIKDNTQITIGGVTLDLSKDNYGLEDWQMEYVTIEVTITGEDGKPFTSKELTADMEYTVIVTIKPKEAAKDTSAGTPNDMDGEDSDLNNTIHVFKPELTFVDSEVWYGGVAPTTYSSNLNQERWINGDKASTDNGVTMLGNKPTLELSYTPETDKIENGKIATKQDIAVDVAVKIGNWDVTEYTKFLHTDCTGKTCAVPEGKEFLLHVNTCQLTVTKTGGAANESYVFDVYKDGVKYTEVTIWGNNSETIYELPVGTYTIQENTGWSWRYKASYSADVPLSSTHTSDTITCTNSIKENKWLNGFSAIVKNVYNDAVTK